MRPSSDSSRQRDERTSRRRRPRLRAGMTLVEIVVSLLILSAVLLVLGAFSAKFAQANSQARLVINANEMAAQRLDAVLQQPTYASVDLLQETGTSVPSDALVFKRNTKVLRVGGGVLDSVDYKLVTVTVTQPSMRKTVSKTSAIAAY